MYARTYKLRIGAKCDNHKWKPCQVGIAVFTFSTEVLP